MISHLCNGLIYQTGLFKGFYSTINLGDANLATDAGDLLVTEESSEEGGFDQIITENGIVNGSIQGVYGYQYKFFPETGYSVQFDETGQSYDPNGGFRGRGGFKDLYCRGNECPSKPVTKITINGSEFYILSLSGGDTSFKYHWILRYEDFDYVAYVTKENFDKTWDPSIGTFTERPAGVYRGSSGLTWIVENEMFLHDFSSGQGVVKIGEFKDI